MRREAANERTNEQTNEWIDGWKKVVRSQYCRLIVLCFENVEIQMTFCINRLVESPKINQSDEMIDPS